MNLRRKLMGVAIMAMLWANGTQTLAQSAVYKTKAGAIKGYDPVAYFTVGKPVKGSEAFTYTWGDAKWYFSSAENRDKFKASPEKYAPQYGGYCAYGMAQGYKAPISTDAWTIVGDKLYLNYDKGVQSTWLKEQKSFIQKADKNWPQVKSTKD